MTPAYLFFAAAICAAAFHWVCWAGGREGLSRDSQSILTNIGALIVVTGAASVTAAIAACFVLALNNWTAP